VGGGGYWPYSPRSSSSKLAVRYFTPRIERVVVALALRTLITMRCFIAGFAIHTRGFVLGVAHPWRSELGEHGLDRGAGFGIEQSMNLAHPINALLVDGQIASPRPLGIVGEIAVLVEQKRQPVGGLPELHGSQPGRDARQVGLGEFAGVAADMAGQIIEEPLDNAHMLRPDFSAGLRSSGIRQLRRQLFTRQCLPRP
jgi:hypothetical protein